VTSAETVLLEQQSVEELRRLLRDPAVPAVVVLLAPQAVAALAARAALPAADAYARLAAFFKRALGAAAVVDTAVGADVALAEAGDEVLARLRADAPPPPWAPPPFTAPYSATRVAPAATPHTALHAFAAQVRGRKKRGPPSGAA
jgi:iron only hydrogenase large subunit-like protein